MGLPELAPEVAGILCPETPVAALLFLLNESHLKRSEQDVQKWTSFLEQSLYDTVGSMVHLSSLQLQEIATGHLPACLQDFILASTAAIRAKQHEPIPKLAIMPTAMPGIDVPSAAESLRSDLRASISGQKSSACSSSTAEEDDDNMQKAIRMSLDLQCEVISLQEPTGKDAFTDDQECTRQDARAEAVCLALLVDNGERTNGASRAQSYSRLFSRIEDHMASLRYRISCGYQVVQTKLLLGDHLWVQRTDGALNLSLAVVRTTVADLVGRSARLAPQQQTCKLRAAGFRQVAILLEGSARETRSAGHMDRATITCEEDLYAYMIGEQLNGVKFAETRDQENTAVWLIAATAVLATSPSHEGPPWWTSVVAQPAQVGVPLPKCNRPCVLGTSAQKNLDEVRSLLSIGQKSVGPGCWPTLEHLRMDVQFALQVTKGSHAESELLLAMRFGLQLHVAAVAIKQAAPASEVGSGWAGLKRRRVGRLNAKVECGSQPWTVSTAPEVGAEQRLFSVQITRMTGAQVLEKIQMHLRSSCKEAAHYKKVAEDVMTALMAHAAMNTKFHLPRFDVKILLIEGLEAARKAVLRSTPQLSEGFHEVLQMLQVLLLSSQLIIKLVPNSKEGHRYQNAVEKLLRQRCENISSASNARDEKTSKSNTVLDLDE